MECDYIRLVSSPEETRFWGGSMKKLFSFVVFLFLFALLQTQSSHGQVQEPKELAEARNSYNAELQKAIKPVNDRYIPKLEDLKKQLTFKGDIKGAVAVDDVIVKMSSGQSIEQQSDKDPQELKEIKKNYMVELETATKPVKSLYLAKLEVLKQQLALSGALKAALAIEEEMGKYTSLSDISSEKDTLYIDEQLLKGESISSKNGRYKLLLKDTGNLVILKVGIGEIWSSGTSGAPVQKLIMQADGNLVLYLPGKRPIWATGTDGKGGNKVVLQDNGSLAIYSTNDSRVWATKTSENN